MTWHQWHHTALIARRIGFSEACASWNAFSPHVRQAISDARLGRGENRNVVRPSRSINDLVQFDLVPEWVEDVDAPPARDRIGAFEASPGLAEPLRDRGEVVHPQREVAARMKTELHIRGKGYVAEAGGEPDPRTCSERVGALDLGKPEFLGVEPASCGFLARRIEDLRVMQ